MSCLLALHHQSAYALHVRVSMAGLAIPASNCLPANTSPSIGFRVRAKPGPTGVQLGLFNHTSYVDAVTMMWLLTPSGVSKASNAKIPLLGTPSCQHVAMRYPLCAVLHVPTPVLL